MAASDSEDDLFEEARQDLRSLPPGQKDLKMPESKELFDETETSNKLLAKGVKETVVAEGNDDAEDNEEKLQKLFISQLRIMGQLENKNSGDSGGTKLTALRMTIFQSTSAMKKMIRSTIFLDKFIS